MNIYYDFLQKNNYDIRKTKDARWIDQKCTFDVLNIIADCILEYIENDIEKEFTVADIWNSEYARENVIEIFSKPDPALKASNEYDKYFGQPIKMLGYSKVLNVRKVKNRNYYTVKNKEILEKIALRPTNSLKFICEYILKVLNDSDILIYFEEFFKEQNKESYRKLREEFINFTISNTNINGETECGRIFAKVLNPLAFTFKKLGTEKGRISKKVITLNDLQYNKFNWRDLLTGKEKFETRSEYEIKTKNLQAFAMSNYRINKAKKALSKYNEKMYNSKSEVNQINEYIIATQIHHIFPQSEYPTIADFVENLIMLTPNQHYIMAHPKNNTNYIDKDFQYICLIAKLTKIYIDLTSDNSEKLYDFEDYKFVLNTGLETEEFSDVKYLDFESILNKIDYFYMEYIGSNKYKNLISQNKIQN